MNNDMNVIPNLKNACCALQILGNSLEGMTQAELQEELSLSRATTFRILTTLRMEGFVRKVGSRYFIGPSLAQFGLKALATLPIKDIGKPILEKLAIQVGETAHLAVLSGSNSLILEVVDSPNPIRVASRAGALADMHCSSTGKVFLAHMPQEEADRVIDGLHFKSRTKKTHTHADALKKELPTIREQGFAIDDEEYFDDVRCLAAPIRDASGLVVAAIGITGTHSRFSASRNQEVGQLVMAAAKEVEVLLC